jgi:hypothetical protein
VEWCKLHFYLKVFFVKLLKLHAAALVSSLSSMWLGVNVLRVTLLHDWLVCSCEVCSPSTHHMSHRRCRPVPVIFCLALGACSSSPILLAVLALSATYG